jgi:hypothetical protein
MESTLAPLIKLETSNPLNRYIKSKTKIPQYEKIIKISPLISVVSDSKRSLMCECCFTFSSKLIPCSKCNTVFYCSKRCLNSKWKSEHSFECDALGKIKESLNKRDLSHFIKEDYKSLEKQIEKNEFKLFDQFFLSLKVFIKCFIQKKEEFMNCMDKLYFSVVNLGKHDRLRLFLYTTYLLHMFQSKISLDKQQIEEFLNQAKQNLIFETIKIEKYFFELETRYVRMMSSKKKGDIFFFKHKYDILQDPKSTMEMIFGIYFFLYFYIKSFAIKS